MIRLVAIGILLSGALVGAQAPLTDPEIEAAIKVGLNDKARSLMARCELNKWSAGFASHEYRIAQLPATAKRQYKPFTILARGAPLDKVEDGLILAFRKASAASKERILEFVESKTHRVRRRPRRHDDAPTEVSQKKGR